MSDNLPQIYVELLTVIANLEETIKIIQKGINEERIVLLAIEEKIDELFILLDFLKIGPTAVSLEEFNLIKTDIKHFKDLRSKGLTALKNLNQNLNEKERELRGVKKTAKNYEKKEKEGALLAFKRKS